MKMHAVMAGPDPAIGIGTIGSRAVLHALWGKMAGSSPVMANYISPR
jgi:hypothetical protein